jgi:hypothetical protein
LVSLGLIPLPLRILGLLFSVIGLFASDVWLSVRLVGFAFWTLYPAALTAERLRMWPFDRMSALMRPVLPIERAHPTSAASSTGELN